MGDCFSRDGTAGERDPLLKANAAAGVWKKPQLKAFADAVGMTESMLSLPNEQGERDGSVESEEGGHGYVEYNKAGEVTKICFVGCRLDGTLPEGDLGMPHLTHLDLGANAASYPSRTGLKGT
jgi:hypothetical protein